jgi:Domain of unknown function DUF11
VLTGLVVPPQLQVTSAPGSARVGPAVYWTDSSLAAGKTVTYTITIKAAAKARGVAAIPVAAGSTQGRDPNPLNNATIKLITLS